MEYLKRPNADPFSSDTVPEEVTETVEDIIEDVSTEGDRAVLKLTSKFDGVDRARNRLTESER